MKIKDGFLLRELAGSYIVIPVEGEATQLNGMITLNETGAFLWKKMEEECTKEQLEKALVEEYGIDEELAMKSVEKFVANIEKYPIWAEE